MHPRDRLLAALARQLGRPSGPAGRLVGRALNRGNRATIAAAIAALELPDGAVAADIGFGGGVGLELLLERPGVATVIGVELSPTMVDAARRRLGGPIATGRLRIEAGSLARLPVADGALDGAITVNTLYFVPDLPAALTECARALRPGGRLVVGVGDPEAMARMPFTAHGFRLRPVAELEAAITAAGLELADHRRVAGARIPAHLLVAAAPGR
jgi:SAM-dependent methyltransferase